MTAVSCSIPCPSTSKACGMLPTFATENVTVPAAMVRVESSTFHSDSLALTGRGAVCGGPGERNGGEQQPCDVPGRHGMHVGHTRSSSCESGTAVSFDARDPG